MLQRKSKKRVLTDGVMPEVGGPQLVEKLREIRQDFEVIYMSGYTDEAVVNHGLLEKGINFVQKPFPLEKLATKIRKVLDEK